MEIAIHHRDTESTEEAQRNSILRVCGGEYQRNPYSSIQTDQLLNFDTAGSSLETGPMNLKSKV
jgi:hypothetical protein